MVAILKIIAVSLAFIPTDVRVTTLDGETTQGVLQELGSDQIVVSSATDGDTTLTVDSVLKLEFTSTEAAANVASATAEAIFLDQSRVPLGQTTASAETLTAESESLGQLAIPRPLLRAVRLQPLKVKWQLQWNAFLERDNEQDLLVVEKRDGTGLDFLAGVVSSIGTDDVPFLLDGDEIPVPRSRVFGIVFANNQKPGDTRTTGVTLQLLSGGSVQASEVVRQNNTFQFKSAWGQILSLATDQLTEIDYSSGRLHYLSDLEPLSERYFGLDPPGKEWGELFAEDAATRTGLSSQWRMSRDRFPNNGRPPLMLHNRVYSKGVCLFPSAAIEYALDANYSRLTAMVGVDDDVASNQQPGRPPTAVELRVEADGKEIFKKLVSAPDEPFLLDLDLAGANTLTVIVDFGDGESTCDYLDLADAKLIVNTQQK